MHQHLSWNDVDQQAMRLAERHARCGHTGVWGVPRGGVAPALMVGGRLGIPMTDLPQHGVLIVDDLIDSGSTAARHAPAPERGCFDALWRKPWSPPNIAAHAALTEKWLVFPWEGDNDGDIEDAIIRLLQYLGEDPTRDGLQETPHRVAKAYRELTEGYQHDPAALLGKTFDVGDVDQMIHVKGIEFVSLCEHHMLPFTGTAHVAYVPGERVVGLSKIPRTVVAFARRLQVQERMTQQIADAIQTHLDPQGVGVKIEAHHSCMGLRGAKQPDATMTTTALTGCFRQPEVRAEFLQG